MKANTTVNVANVLDDLDDLSKAKKASRAKVPTLNSLSDEIASSLGGKA
jgi:hypothetical protein